MDLEVLKEKLKDSAGVVLRDDSQNNVYLMPFDTTNPDDVFVGPLRYDQSDLEKKIISLFCGGD